MRRLVWIVLVLGTLWCVWWFGASAVLRTGVERWLDARRAESWQAEASAIKGGGFPTHLTAHLQNPIFADPGSGVAVSMDALHLELKAWRPGHARVMLPETPIRLASPDAQAELTMSDGTLVMETALRRGRGLGQLAWTAGPWGISRAEGSVLSARDLTVAMVQTDVAETYELRFDAKSLRLGTVPRTRLRVPDDWPATFDSLRMDMTVTFDRPWDLRALEERRPQPRQVSLHLAEAAWGKLRLNFAAELDVDASGTASGEISVQAENWEDMLRLAETAGALPKQMREQLVRAIGAIARSSGNPASLDLTLTARNGRLLLGFVPVGAAPVLRLR